MSTKGGKYRGHRFHGDPQRFEVVADFIAETFGRNIDYIADVAGGRGMLTRILRKSITTMRRLLTPEVMP